MQKAQSPEQDLLNKQINKRREGILLIAYFWVRQNVRRQSYEGRTKHASCLFAILSTESQYAWGAFKTLYPCVVDELVATGARDENGYGEEP